MSSAKRWPRAFAISGPCVLLCSSGSLWVLLGRPVAWRRDGAFRCGFSVGVQAVLTARGCSFQQACFFQEVLPALT